MPKKVEDCVSSVLEDTPDYSESRAWAICKAQQEGMDTDEIEVQALGDVSGDLTGLAKQESPCWDGYVMVGTKTVDGRDVPNCVPEEDAEPMEEQASDEATQQAVATAVLERQLDYLAQSDHTPWIRESSEQGIAWVDPTAGAVVYEQDSYTDYPEAAKENAQQALDWREEHGRDEVTAGTRTGWIRANQLADGEAISRETVGRMAAFRRHEDNAEIDAEHEGTPWKDNGYVAWLLWGGDEGVSWAERIVDSEDTSEEQAVGFGVDVYRITQTSDEGPATQGDVLGIAVDMPNAGVYVDWNIDAWPDGEQLSEAHVSDYGNIEDLAQVTQGELEPIETVDASVVEQLTTEEQAADLTQLTFDDKQQAEAVADIIGCEGSHSHNDGHMPCNSHAELQSIVGDDGEIGGEQQAIVVEGLSQEGREYIESTYDVEVSDHE